MNAKRLSAKPGSRCLKPSMDEGVFSSMSCGGEHTLLVDRDGGLISAGACGCVMYINSRVCA